jgi:predicted dehydrogenase
MAMIKVGLVGLGFMGRTHLPRYLDSDKAELVAVADVDSQRLLPDAVVEGNIDTGLPPCEIPAGVATFGALGDMLKGTEVDMVDICLPTFLHARAAVEAAEAGKHVLCEKPMALTLDECQAMIDAARINGVQLMIAQCLRFWPEYLYLKDTVDSQRLGRLQSLNMRRLGTPPLWSWENWFLDAQRSGGPVIDLQIHDVDFINFLLGPPQGVFAQGIEQGVSGDIDLVTGSFLYPEMKVTAEAGWMKAPGFGFYASYDALFERGMVRLAPDQEHPLTVYEEGQEPCAPDVGSPDGYTAEIDFFLGCLSEGRDVASTFPPESAQTSIKMALLEKESIAKGEIIPFV